MLLLLVLLFVSVIMPVAIALRLMRLDAPSRGGWLFAAADGVAFVAAMLVLARWDIAGLWTRYALGALTVVAVAVSWYRHRGKPWRPLLGGGRTDRAARLLSLALFAGALVYVATGLITKTRPVALAFPLENGRFVVAQGGDNPLLNHHNGHEAQRHALDITAVGRFGFRADGILPGDVERYAIFGARVVSPCGGEVVRAVDGLPDLPPPRADPEHPAGNMVAIACEGVEVELAHLRQGSLRVAAGDSVEAGTVIGAVGNSGNTTEPHLHIHAVDPATGEGVPIGFAGRTPVRNAVFER